MGTNSAAPEAPANTAASERPPACPSCGHDENMGEAEPALWRIIFRRPKPYSCAHFDVEQDALVDNTVRCPCAHGWHF